MAGVPDKVNVTGGTIRYQGLFDMEGLYQAAVDWCKSHRYWFHEETYKHKVPSPLGAEQEIWWRMEAKVTEFFKFYINIILHMWEMTEVEVVKDGKKKILTSARLQITMKGVVEADWQGKFKGTKFKELLKTILKNYIWKKEFTTVYGDMLYYRMWNLHTLMKKYLDMQTAWNEYAGYLRESQ
jgi:hypothetical protein